MVYFTRFYFLRYFPGSGVPIEKALPAFVGTERIERCIERETNIS